MSTVKFIRIKTLEELKEGSEVMYVKPSSGRHNWVGIISDINLAMGRFTIRYDNGIEQDYSKSALLQTHGSAEYDSTYIKVIDMSYAQQTLMSQQTSSCRTSIRPSEVLVVNMTHGKVMCVESDAEIASGIAYEMAQDSQSFERFGVFARKASFVNKRPKTIKD